MGEEHTTSAIRHHLERLAADSPAEATVRRLHRFGATVLHRGYPRLTRPPVNLPVPSAARGDLYPGGEDTPAS
jgi:RNA polymerase sigma-70 factor (ECF subfamily)